MVKIIISLRSVSQSNQRKSVFPQVLKWLSSGLQGLGAGTIIKNAYSCIHFRCPLEKCFYLWRCAGLLICAMEGLCNAWHSEHLALRWLSQTGALCAHTDVYRCVHRNVPWVLTLTTHPSAHTKHSGRSRAVPAWCLSAWVLIQCSHTVLSHHSGTGFLWIEVSGLGSDPARCQLGSLEFSDFSYLQRGNRNRQSQVCFWGLFWKRF